MGTTVATYAIIDAGYPFLTVFGNNAHLLMLMAAVTGVALVIAARMAGRAGRVVIAIKYEKAAVIECCQLPCRRLMAG